MSLTPLSDATAAGALIPSQDSALATSSIALGGAPHHVIPVILSFTVGNYSKWSIYMKASLGRAGYLGHIDDTITAAPIDPAWQATDYTVLNVLHATIDEDVTNMILTGNQTARQLWLATRDLFSTNKANKVIYLDNNFHQLL
jgi:hypothetical protein